MRTIGETIAYLRTEKGLRQKDLSNILSLSPSSISNYETGAYWPDMDTLCKIADYFNVTTDYLLGRTEYRCPPEILDKYATKDYAIHNIVNTLVTLDSASVDAAVKYVNYLKENHDRMHGKPPANNPGNLRKAPVPSKYPHKAPAKNPKSAGHK